MPDEDSEYEKAYREIELFDSMVMATITTQREVSVPFHHCEDKTDPIELRMAATLYSLNAQMAEMLDAGMNPSQIIRGFMQPLQDAYINPSNNKEAMGRPETKKDQAIKNIAALVLRVATEESLEQDLKAIV